MLFRSLEQHALPATLDYLAGAFAWYAPLFERNVVVDFVRADADLSGYDVVIVPSLFCASSAALENLAAVSARGGHLLVTYQTGITDLSARITDGGYLGALQSALGVQIEEFAPLAPPDLRATGGGAAPTIGLAGDISGAGSLWSEVVHATDAEVIATFGDGALVGMPAITRRGTAWYVATQPDPAAVGALLERVLGDAGVRMDAAGGTIERVRRGPYEFTIDHATQEVGITRD